MLLTGVNQAGAAAGGDLIGRDKVANIYQPQNPASYIEKMMGRLSAEIESKAEVRYTIDELQFFYTRKTIGDVIGLEAKLKRADRLDELLYAFEKKELFAKILDRYSLYASAQRIFAYLLAKAEWEFMSSIQPVLSVSDCVQINELITKRIVEPIVSDCDIGPFDFNHSVVVGMVYWLAEQCFVRWHE